MESKSVRLTVDVVSKIQSIAKKNDWTKSVVVRRALNHYETVEEIDSDVLSRLKAIRDEYRLKDISVVIRDLLDKTNDSIE